MGDAGKKNREFLKKFVSKKVLRERLQEQRSGVIVTGINDPTIDKRVEYGFSVSEYFPDEVVYERGSEMALRYPIEFSLETPRPGQTTGEFSCKFTKRGSSDVTVNGAVTPSSTNFNYEKNELTVICVPEQKLNGSYDLEVSVVLLDLRSSSRLLRAYIGEKDQEWKSEWLPQLTSTYFGGGRHSSQAPNDPVRINFAIGNTPFVETTDGLAIFSSIENRGSGEIMEINEYQIEFNGGVDNARCLNGFIATEELLKRSRIILPTCFVENLPLELADPQDFVLRETIGYVSYDYKVSHTERIKVEEVVTS